MSDEQWGSVLRTSLLHQRAQKSEVAPVEKLETVATIAGGVIAIHFRNNISGITQKLGEILLKQNEDEEIDAIKWCGVAVQRSTNLEAEIQDLTARYDEQGKTIEKLNNQLEELIEAKKTHEGHLLEKFRELLNSKKLKIRHQQRLLASAKVDPKQVAKIENARKSSTSHTPTASRAGKRKAKDAAPASESSEDESFERKAQTQKEESDGSERGNTPEASDQDATEDESDDDLDSAPRPDSVPDRGKEKVNVETDKPPPSRELPFGNSGTGGGQEQSAELEADRSTLNQEAGNEDEETDDDEL